VTGLTVGIVGCGLIGRKRASALRPEDSVVACMDVDADAARALADEHGAAVAATLDDLLDSQPDVVVVATPHDQLAAAAARALEAGTHVLVEKPAAIGSDEIARLIAARDRSDRVVKVGFNHRFHPGIARVAAEVHSGAHGDLMFVRARYGHGGRVGYEQEWRADPARSGGGELIDQGLHLLDLTHWLAGPLPLHSAILRTHFWDTVVEDNAALVLGEGASRTAPWALIHVSWTEWKNMFSLEVYCERAKLQVDGLVGSYGPQTLRIYRMKPELGPPDLDEIAYDGEDVSWHLEWRNVVAAVEGAASVSGGLEDALYAWHRVEDAYADSPYAEMRTAPQR
jgi:predicted dehydrogenase